MSANSLRVAAIAGLERRAARAGALAAAYERAGRPAEAAVMRKAAAMRRHWAGQHRRRLP